MRCGVFVAVTIALAATAMGPSTLVSARQSQVASERASGPTVDFLALDADGNPLADLQATDIEVRVADRVRVVRALRRVSAGPAPALAGVRAGSDPALTPRVPAPYGTNAAVTAGRRFLLIVDQESFVAGREQLFRGAVEGLLAQFAPGDRAMVAALPFGGVLTPFTADIERIRLALGRVTGQGARGESGSDLACRTRRFLESLDAFLRSSGTQSLPQTMILFTSGLAAPRRDAPATLMPGMCELVVDLFRHVGTAASAARTNVYVMQPADIGIGTSLPRSNIAGVGDNGSDNPVEGIEHLAGVTGGARLPLDAAGTASLLRIARESAAYYVAELEPADNEVFDRTRPLSVRVKRRGVTVRARPEIAFTQQKRRAAARLAVGDVLASGEALSDVPLRVGGFTVRDATGSLRVGVLVEPVDASATLASAGAVLIDGAGRGVAQWNARDATERPLLGAMSAPAGSYRVRVAAIDATGHAGVAETEVDAILTNVGALSLGSLLLSASHAGVTSLQLEFGSEPTARAAFDIYGGAEGQRLAATLELSRDLDGPAIAKLPLALTRADDTRVVAMGTIPLGALPPGDYVVRGIIRLEDGTTGRVVRTLRKIAK
jgi:hypothetical protein